LGKSGEKAEFQLLLIKRKLLGFGEVNLKRPENLAAGLPAAQPEVLPRYMGLSKDMLLLRQMLSFPLCDLNWKNPDLK
jgi:hypothetical protein